MNKKQADRELLARVHALNFPVTICPAGKTTPKHKITEKGKLSAGAWWRALEAEDAPKKTPMPIPATLSASQVTRIVNGAKANVDQVLQATFGNVRVV